MIMTKWIMHLLSTNFHQNKIINNKSIQFNNYSLYSVIKNNTVTNIFASVTNITYSYSKKFELVEVKYFIKFTNDTNDLIKPSDITFVYNMHILCDIYINENQENIYSLANIYNNQLFFCVEYMKINENINFGIKIYSYDEDLDKIKTNNYFFFTDKLIILNFDPIFENNNKFNINYIRSNYFKLLFNIIPSMRTKKYHNESFQLKFSYMKPPLSYLKREIAYVEGRWYYNNIYENYFCFCRGESCINLKLLNNYMSQSCKYFFYLTIIDNNRYLYQKTHYFFSDFFSPYIESIDTLPIFKKIIKENLNSFYLTVSPDIYNNLCLNKTICGNIIYGVRKIDGDFLEKYLDLLLRLKAVIAAERYDSIDNIFYNIEYITYIFICHGVQYIKSFLYNDYYSFKNYNKVLLPPSKTFIDLAVNAGWKMENIIKQGLPRWDNYFIKDNKNNNKKERAIFLMFTWRNVKYGKNMSDLYYSNLFKIFNHTSINQALQKNNIKLFYCYHHTLKEKRRIKTNSNIVLINQNSISTLLKNSSLIITDFSSIIFDAIAQNKPLILYLPDGLDKDLKNIYTDDYSETIEKLKNGTIYLYELFLDLNDVISKILYYIKNDFVLEEQKRRFYQELNLEIKNNTGKFIDYLKNIT